MKIAALIVLGLVGFASAECPDACSGHGFCGQFDKCTCYRNWMGNSCEKRTCPYDLAFVDLPVGDLNMDSVRDETITTMGAQINDRLGMEVWPTNKNAGSDNNQAFYDAADDGHFYAECSNKGMCDRKSGLCSCFDGYSGTACRRVACPNDCSGHGTCERMEEFGQKYWVNQANTGYEGDYGGHNKDINGDAVSGKQGFHNYAVHNAGSGTAFTYELWDRYKSQVCACDPGYFGIDCSQRYCPRGDDPLTINQFDETQWVTVACGTGACSGTFRLTYKDEFGETWDTMPIAKADFAGDSAGQSAMIKSALKGIPNNVFEDVTVVVTGVHQPLPGFATATAEDGDLTYPTGASGTNNALTNTEYGNMITTDTHGITECGTNDVPRTVTSITDDVGAGDVLELGAGPALGNHLCRTDLHGYRAKITFTKNPGNLNMLYSADSQVSVADSFSFALGAFGASAATVGTSNFKMNNFVGAGDRIRIGSTDGEDGTVMVLATDPIAAVDGNNLGSFTTTANLPSASVAISAFDAPKAYAEGEGNKELQECSLRGVCDHSSGLCECFNGYTNEDCGMQQALAA